MERLLDAVEEQGIVENEENVVTDKIKVNEDFDEYDVIYEIDRPFLEGD